MSLRRPRTDHTSRSQQIKIELERDGIVLTDDLSDQIGGGVVQTLSLAFRAVFIAMTRKTPLLILDEPCNALSKQHREPFISFMKKLSDRTGLQVIFVTHDTEFAQGSNKVIEL